ncbi:hypothetical protein FRC12_000897 [Ceratobasidium sp. 428]|nr:hypothetical protein FRC12_000897 [Ceratobasidium sp. 428]
MNGEVKQTFARLNDFTNIRAMLYQDAEVLLNYITTAGSIDEPTMLRIQFMQSVYTALMPAVRMYATRVSSSSLPPA